MSESEPDTSRTTVRTYVPAYQRDEWDDHAEELGMSRSEFVRTMVQAGRRGFGVDDEQSESTPPDKRDGSGEQLDATGNETDGTGSSQTRSGADTSDQLEEQVLETLSAAEFLPWDELLAALTEDMEARLESTLQDLQAANEIRYSGRNGGYTLDE